MIVGVSLIITFILLSLYIYYSVIQLQPFDLYFILDVIFVFINFYLLNYILISIFQEGYNDYSTNILGFIVPVTMILLIFFQKLASLYVIDGDFIGYVLIILSPFIILLSYRSSGAKDLFLMIAIIHILAYVVFYNTYTQRKVDLNEGTYLSVLVTVFLILLIMNFILSKTDKNKLREGSEQFSSAFKENLKKLFKDSDETTLRKIEAETLSLEKRTKAKTKLAEAQRKLHYANESLRCINEKKIEIFKPKCNDVGIGNGIGTGLSLS